MKNTIILISTLLVASLAFNFYQYCGDKKQGESKEDFCLWSSDSVFIDRTLEAYDAFVRSKMGDELPLSEAYKRFFVETREKKYITGDYGLFVPDSTFVYQWTSDFVGGRLQNFLFEPAYASPRERQQSKFPQGWGGWYYRIIPWGIEGFGHSVTKNNRAWKGWIESTLLGGDIFVPYTMDIVDDINFDNRHERFLAVIGFMNGCFDHRDFNLVKDVARNDSLKAEWLIEMERRLQE